ncbi:MAG TPA: YHS domain-containing (seleno)protein [Xanthobacteraceae bacterium]|nr:YHS domain-containing (seleno)protein [Xanthobacteraceae bacterium]
MTAARQKKKQYWFGLAAIAALLVYVGLVFVSAAVIAAGPAASADERIVVDWHTGLAIDGYDPVAYFTDGKPLQGSPNLELRKSNVIWRFINVGNRAAFAAAPNVYMPQYGGYDPIGVARGLAVAGNPNVWLIQGQRLFLFYDSARRQKFAGGPNRVIAAADRKWTDVQRTITP